MVTEELEVGDLDVYAESDMTGRGGELGAVGCACAGHIRGLLAW